MAHKRYERKFLEALEPEGHIEREDESEWYSYGKLKTKTRFSDPTLSSYLKWAQDNKYIERDPKTRKYKLMPKGRSYYSIHTIMSTIEDMSSVAVGPKRVQEIWESLMLSESKETTFLPHALVSSASKNRYKVALEQDVFGAVFADKNNKFILKKPYIDNFIVLDLGYYSDELIHTLRYDAVHLKVSPWIDLTGVLTPEQLKAYYSTSGAFFVHFSKNRSALQTIEQVVSKGSAFLHKIGNNSMKLERMLVKKGLPVETVRNKFKNFTRQEFLLMINYLILCRIVSVGQTKSGKVIIGSWMNPERLRQQMTSIQSVYKLLKEQEGQENLVFVRASS